MYENIAIKVEDLIKIYPIYNSKNDRMKEALSLTRKKFHTEFHALNNINFEIKKGETVGIIGQNGSGKSTLLKILTGVLSPTSGNVMVNGKVSALLELGAGFNPEMTGLENIYLNGTIMGYTKEEMDERIPQIIDFADIGEFINQQVKMYSSGMFVRLAFAVAINVEPDILIIDEALAVGDALFQRKCFSSIEKFKKQNKTIIFVSHDSNAVLDLCDKAILLEKGEKILIGKTKNVVNLYHKILNTPTDKIFNIVNQAKQGAYLAECNDMKHCIDEYTHNQIEIEEFFDDSLNSENKIRYVQAGAEILDCEIVTLNKKRVNVLSPSKEYYWTYKVKFTKEYNNVGFGMLVKTLKGIELGGAMTSNYKYEGISVKEGDEYQISFKLSPKLAEGIYFFNCGVFDYKNSEIVYLDRIIDSQAFRIQCSVKTFTGIINFGIENSIVKCK